MRLPPQALSFRDSLLALLKGAKLEEEKRVVFRGRPARLLLRCMLTPPQKQTEAPVRIVPFLLLLAACATPVDTTAPNAKTGPQPPTVIERFDPEYPSELRKDRVGGVVKVEAIIDKSGNIREPRVLSTPDFRLNEPALDAIRKWRFRPGTVDGEPVEVIFAIDMQFTPPAP